MSGYKDYYIAAAALAFGLIIIGVTRWIEHRRVNNPMPHLVPTTPFMLFGAIVILVAIVFSLSSLPSTPTANLDGRRSKSKANLTSDEIAEFKARLSTCWVPPGGTTSGQLLIRVLLEPDGSLSAKPELIRVSASLSAPALVESAMRALQRCQPYNVLPATKYEQWKILDLGFSPQGPAEVSTPSAYKDFRPQ